MRRSHLIPYLTKPYESRSTPKNSITISSPTGLSTSHCGKPSTVPSSEIPVEQPKVEGSKSIPPVEISGNGNHEIWFIVGVMILAVIPSLLVFLERWVGDQQVRDLFRQWWCKSSFLCNMAFPSYFILVFICFILILAIFAFRSSDSETVIAPQPIFTGDEGAITKPEQKQRRLGSVLLFCSVLGMIVSLIVAIVGGGLPGVEFALLFLIYIVGWLLKDVPTRSIFRILRANRLRLTLIIYAHLSMVGVIASFFTSSNLWLFALPILIMSIISLLKQQPRISPAFWVMSLALILYVLYLDGWWFAIVGDEYEFYRFARYIVDEQRLSTIGYRLFTGNAAYGTHPYLSSLIQAVSMKIFGGRNFGWRFSSVYLSALSVGIIYPFLKTFLQKRLALFTALFLASSHYIMSFSKIGYNNLQAFFILSLNLWAVTWTIKTRRPLGFVLLGTTLGLCFYVYPAALFIPPIPLLLLMFYHPPKSRSAIQHWSITIVTTLLLMLPLFLQPDYWITKISGTLFYSPELIQSASRLGTHLVTNFLYALFSFVYIAEESHFVAVSYLGPLTAALVFIGIASLFPKVRREKFSGFLMVSFFYLLFFLGATHDRLFPSTTRMFLLLPWFAIFAAVGFGWIMKLIGQLNMAPHLSNTFATLLMLAVIVLNIYQAYPLSKRRMADHYQSIQVLFLLEADRLLNSPETPSTRIVLLNQPETYIAESLYELLDLYEIPYKPGQLVELNVNEQGILKQVDDLATNENSLVIIIPWIEDEIGHSIEQVLKSGGSEPYEVMNTIGNPAYEIWHNSTYREFGD